MGDTQLTVIIIVSFVVGILLGRFFKVLVMVHMTGMLVAVILCTSIYPKWSIQETMLVWFYIMVALQIGYFVGACIVPLLLQKLFQ
jgi:predicted lysophospholipase L1 biosynthesis ABC-type transport system permease subunit